MTAKSAQALVSVWLHRCAVPTKHKLQALHRLWDELPDPARLPSPALVAAVALVDSVVAHTAFEPLHAGADDEPDLYFDQSLHVMAFIEAMVSTVLHYRT